MEKVIIGIVFALYMAVMIGIGVYFYFKNKNDKDAYLLAGRSLNPWVASMSAQASDMSGWLLTGLPGLAALSLVALGKGKEAIWTAIGLFIGTLLNWIFVGKRLRVYTEVLDDAQTLPEYFQKRFNDKKGLLRAVSAIIFLIFFTVYTASMFSASAKLFNSVFEIPYITALFVGAIIIVVYVFLGGFLAVSYTDLVQGLLMFFTLLIIPFVMIGKLDTSQSTILKDLLGEVAKLFPTGAENDISWIQIISCIGWGLGYCGMPHILVRFMATKDKKVLKPATVIASIWCILTLTSAILIGIMGSVYVPGLVDTENVFIAVVQKLFNPFISGIMLSAVLAAIMSTADSQLLVASTAFANDFYNVVLRKKAGQKELIWVSRITIIVVSLIAVLIALDQNSSIFTLVSYAWAGFGASFGPVVLFSLYSNKLTLKGAVSSICSGAIVTIVLFTLKALGVITGGFWMIYEIIPGFVVSSLVLWIVSLIDKKGSIELKEGFNKMLIDVKSKDVIQKTIVISNDNINNNEIITENSIIEDDANIKSKEEKDN